MTPRTRRDQPRQLTLEVALHPVLRELEQAARERGTDWTPYLAGSLKITGELRVSADLEAGDRLTVQIAGPDGEVIAHGIAEVDLVSFPLIKDDGHVIGVERAHKAKLVE